ncbi:sulfite exporter TauE/SafE family protein [Pseudovibrio sp. Tun.PSC04-5.I4]|uniref:sulfite exporter TauE/SafE family protein n=1 Tax=Pseudovibrio sp. Tun.PSC04-5.I4 TaxID=1798213 RepID=UPI00087E9BC5|nr:sulfite exporter TauE/SafE family protein [Pseudovibrio sp. Tun.PSC04-5.I4]SDR32806.1 hypothetical protein SAMN04515695_4538 [Pseudovibrio sp. Tun.PSC04-5.I4]
MLPDVAGLESTALLMVCATVALAGLTRGFCGFGAAMVYMPIASSIIAPKLAAASLMLIDGLISIPMAASASKICDWRTVLPAAAGAFVTVSIGAWVLTHSDPQNLRWVLSAVVLLLLCILISGWRYTKPPKKRISFGVGAVSGLLGGMTQLAGPPVITYWMSGPAPISIIRANLITYFFFTSIGSFFAFWGNGLITQELFKLTLVIGPAYFICNFVGAKGFALTNGKSYRPLAYSLILVAAITSLPILDGILR